MSYDVCIGGWSANMTSNVGRMYYDHIAATDEHCGGLHALHGKTGAQCVVILSDAFDAIARTRLDLWDDHAVGEPAFCAKYDAENGWGSAVGGLIFLAQILAACARHPRHRLTLSA